MDKMWNVEDVGVVGPDWAGWMNLVEVLRWTKGDNPLVCSREVIHDLLYAEMAVGTFHCGGGTTKAKITRMA